LLDLHAAQMAFQDLIGPAFAEAATQLTELAAQGVSVSVSVSGGFLEMGRRWAPELTGHIARLLRSGNTEPVVTDPAGGIVFAFDIHRFMRTVAAARHDLAELAGQPVRAVEISGFSTNHEIYHTLARLNLTTVIVEGASRVSSGRQPARLSRFGRGPLVAQRLQWLSDELRYHLRVGDSNCSRMCDTIARIPGDVAVVHFQFDSLAFGADAPGRGIETLATLAQGCADRGVPHLTISAATDMLAARAAEHAPPTLTATSGPAVEELAGDGWTERLIFGRMQQAYHTGRLAGGHWDAGIGEWLLQGVNLSLPSLAADPDGRPPTYWPAHWWASDPSYTDTAEQVVALYDVFIRSAALHVGKGAER
jgi:hypothetical protein